jgi:hypothetical protein
MGIRMVCLVKSPMTDEMSSLASSHFFRDMAKERKIARQTIKADYPEEYAFVRPDILEDWSFQS